MTQKQDFFTVLGGRVKFRRGLYNITSDAVWLAEFARVAGAKTVLDAGIGTGGVSLCLLERNPSLKITGIDSSEQMLAECAQNAILNDRKIELIKSDIMKWKTDGAFDAVVTNPPYFKGTPRRIADSESPWGAKMEKNYCHHNANIYEWIRACLKRVRPRGYFFAIIDGALLPEVIGALRAGRAGAVEILPLFGAKKTAERVLISARLGVKTGSKIYLGISMNDPNVLQNGNLQLNRHNNKL
jgi:tRNA1(Val) A37 N6-methylase TrmN6